MNFLTKLAKFEEWSTGLKQVAQQHKIDHQRGTFLNSSVCRQPHKKMYLGGRKLPEAKQASLLFRSVQRIPQIQVNSLLRPPGNEPLEMTKALKQLQGQNKKQQADLEKALDNLPSPPTAEPSGGGRSMSRLMTGDEKAKLIPSSFNDLSQYINRITQTKDLVETWKALPIIALKSGLSSLHLSLLKDRFSGKLLKVSKNPEQADLITENHLRVMIPDMKKRHDFAGKIFLNQSLSVDVHRRFDELRRR